LGEALTRHFTIQPQVEWTVEANPGTLTAEKIQTLRRLGVNRLSLGVQSFDDSLLKIIGRSHSAAEAGNAVALAQKNGMANLNLDLIYGLPGQSVASWRTTLEEALSLGVQHLSLYGLQLEAGTPLAAAVEAGELVLPTEDEELLMYYLGEELLSQAGYRHYEISNYALPGKECLHNLTYWTYNPYLGLGAGAFSCLDLISFQGLYRPQPCLNNAPLDRSPLSYPGLSSEQEKTSSLTSGEDTILVRWGNIGDPVLYTEHWRQASTLALAEREEISPRLAQQESLMLAFRLLEGLSLEDYQSHFGSTLEEDFPGVVQELRGQGLLQQEGQRLKLTSQGVIFNNRIGRAFVNC